MTVEERIKDLQNQKESLEQELATYESDFRILSGMKEELSKIYVICENSSYALQCFNDSMRNTHKVQENVNAKPFQRLFDFAANMQMKSTEINTTNNSLMDEIGNYLPRFDRDLETIGNKVSELKNKINRIISYIEAIKSGQ